MDQPPNNLYVTIYSFEAENEAELSFQEGNIIQVIGKSNDDWWEGRLGNGRTGLFPANRVQLYVEPSVATSEPSEVIVQSTPSLPSPGSNNQAYSQPGRLQTGASGRFIPPPPQQPYERRSAARVAAPIPKPQQYGSNGALARAGQQPAESSSTKLRTAFG